MALETIATLADAVKTYYERQLLESLQAKYLHGMFAQGGEVKEIPGGSGKTVEWRRYGNLTAATTPLTEGVTPNGINHSVTLVTATPSQYGAVINHSEVLQMTMIDPFLAVTAQKFGNQAGDTLDQVCRDVLVAGTNVQYADAVANRASVDTTNKLDATEVLKAVRALEAADVPRIPDEFGGSYMAIVHPNAAYDIRQDATWLAADEYAGSGKIFSGELGRLFGARFIASSNAKIFTGAGVGAIDVYATLVIGLDAYGKCAFPGQSQVEFIVKPVGSAGSADPLNQRGSVGWKVSEKTLILEESRIRRIEHAVSS